MKKLSQEEAAKVLEDMKVKIEIPKAAVTQWKRNTALDMAIEALKCSEVPNSSDCISRQAAIDALGEKPLAWTEGEYELGLQNQWQSDVDAVKELPSVTPEPCEDAVSRKAVQYLLAHFVNEDKYNDACDGLKHLPSVTPKQRTGKWISADAMFHGVPFYCSECGENTRDTVMGKPRWKFCPNCGAKMEVTE